MPPKTRQPPVKEDSDDDDMGQENPDMVNAMSSTAPTPIHKGSTSAQYGNLINSNMATLDGTQYPTLYDDIKQDSKGLISAQQAVHI